MIEFKLLPELKLSFIDKISKLQKKALKHDITISYEILELHTEYKKGELFSFHIVTVSYDKPMIQYKGYEYIATLQKTDNGNMVFSDNEGRDLTKYFDMAFRCDHCKTNRNRNKVHLFLDSNGNDLMVASSCAKEYFGINIYDKIEGFTVLYEKLMNLEDEFENESKFKSEIDINELLLKTFYVINIDKRYYSSNKPDSYGNTTIDYVNALNPIKASDYIEVTQNFNLDSFYEYWQTKVADDKTEFNNNIFLSLSTSVVKSGLVVYSVFDYVLNATELIQKKSTSVVKNEYYGEIKDKIEFTGEIVKTGSYESKYGITYIYTIHTTDNYVLVWSTNKVLDTGLKATFKGTIKDHDEYNGQKQTKITRCKIIESAVK